MAPGIKIDSKFAINTSCLFISASEKMQRKLRQRLKQQQFQHLMQHKQLQQQTETTSPGETMPGETPLKHTNGN